MRGDLPEQSAKRKTMCFLSIKGQRKHFMLPTHFAHRQWEVLILVPSHVASNLCLCCHTIREGCSSHHIERFVSVGTLCSTSTGSLF
mmetsp:Transcript_37301/g.89313  ORF Transcript_37301/g.89313 Transcript_37301/m.89313 type:complete len:87 (+) Transcript_37301:1768-2028(+)